MRDYHVTVLADGCAAPTPALHDAALADLRSVADLRPAGLHRGNRPMNGPDAQPAPELSLPVLIIGGGAWPDRRHPAGAVGRGMRDRA